MGMIEASAEVVNDLQHKRVAASKKILRLEPVYVTTVMVDTNKLAKPLQ